MYTCTKCGETKPLQDFHKRSAVKRGHDSWCKTCKAEYRHQYFLKNKEWEVSRSRIKAWKGAGIGISLEEYTARLKDLNNQCQICGTNAQTLHVDHCHDTGRVRGLLCGSCNRALGLFKDSPEVLEKAKQYLKTHD